jgi:hypothetical protein
VGHTPQAQMVQQSLVREVARDVYAKRRDERRALSSRLRLARIEVLLDEAIVELAIIKRDVKAAIEQAEAKAESGEVETEDAA